MPTAAITGAGSTLAISATAPATENATGFGAVTYTDVGEVVSIGEYGAISNLVTHNPLADRKTYKFKGSYNNGSLAVNLAKAVSDAGQVILAAAGAPTNDADYTFEVTLSDGSIQYFTAKVMSYTTVIDGVDSIIGSTAQIEIISDIIEVAA